MEFGIASVAGITVICYLAAQAVKATNLDNKWLPVICGVLGGILGVVGLYWIPEYPAQDIITAIAVGIMSGLAATGVNRSISSYPEKKREKIIFNCFQNVSVYNQKRNVLEEKKVIYELKDSEKGKAIFEGWQETMIYSCLQKVMGHIYVTDFENPKSAVAIVGCFAFTQEKQIGSLFKRNQKGLLFWYHKMESGKS